MIEDKKTPKKRGRKPKKSELVINVCDKYADVLKFEKHHVLIRGGRASGKSAFAGQLISVLTTMFPERDIIVGRDSFSDLRASTYEEIKSWIDELGLNEDFIVGISPLSIINKRTKCNIYFLGIGGSDTHRTKSFKPQHKLIAVLFEEVQQIQDQESLEQAHATFRRFLDTEKGMIIHLYNPEPRNNHWLNIYWNMKVNDPDWLCIHTTYKDIVRWLNDIDLKEILKLKMLDPLKYEWLYEGNPSGAFGGCYPQFKRGKHFIPMKEIQNRFNRQRIVALIIGTDGAVNNDCTVLTPIAVMQNGQAVVLELFYHDPKTSGVKSSAELCPYISIWLRTLIKKYNLGENSQDQMAVPIIFKVDSAAAELIRILQFNFSQRCTVNKFSKPTIIEMVDIVCSSLAKNMIFIGDYGGYYDYVRATWVSADNPLAYQLEMVQWNEAQTGYDPRERNDATDAFTYGVCTYFRNPDNLYWLQSIISTRKSFYDDEFN